MRTEVVVDKSFSILNAILIILGAEQTLMLIWAIATLPVSKQEALRYKNGCFCYLYTESYFYIFDFVWKKNIIFNKFFLFLFSDLSLMKDKQTG